MTTEHKKMNFYEYFFSAANTLSELVQAEQKLTVSLDRARHELHRENRRIHSRSQYNIDYSSVGRARVVYREYEERLHRCIDAIDHLERKLRHALTSHYVRLICRLYKDGVAGFPAEPSARNVERILDSALLYGDVRDAVLALEAARRGDCSTTRARCYGRLSTPDIGRMFSWLSDPRFTE